MKTPAHAACDLHDKGDERGAAENVPPFRILWRNMQRRREQDADSEPIVEPLPDCFESLITGGGRSERSPVSFALRRLQTRTSSETTEAAESGATVAVTVIDATVTRTNEKGRRFPATARTGRDLQLAEKAMRLSSLRVAARIATLWP